MAKKENGELLDSSELVECKENLDKLRKRETERLMRRDAERHKDLEKKKEEKEQSSANNEKIDFFLELFNDKKEEIENTINDVSKGEVEKSQLPSQFDKITKSIHSLQNYVAASSYFLREYDLRTSKVIVHNLLLKCQELEEKLIPKKKFSFKLRKMPSVKESFVDKTENGIAASLVKGKSVDSAVVLNESVCGFVQKMGQDLSLSHDVICKKDVILSCLEDCTIHMPGVPSTMHISGLKNCRVLCGPIVTSVFIEDCVDCTFVLASQQMRIHSTKHCDFYIHVTSRVVIEDTKEVRFAPYNWRYDNTDWHFELAELNKSVNNWDFIDDFNWLACDKPSPHWRTIKDNERVQNWSGL